MDNRFGNICMCRRCDGVVHTIRRGDTLYLLSRHYNVTVNDIMNANRNINIYNLRIGDQLCIPVRRTMNENIMENVRDDIREEIIEDIIDDIEVSNVENNEVAEVMQTVVSEEAGVKDKKISDIIDMDMTLSELARMLKEIDK